jgi:hypothetical protein
VDDILSNALISSAYPNPATNQFTIDFEFPIGVEKAELKLFNLVGQEVLSKSFTGINGKIQVSVADLPEGIYFYNLVLNEESAFAKKLIVRR